MVCPVPLSLCITSTPSDTMQSRPDVKIDEETRPIVTIAWARYYLARLDSSIAVRESGIPDAPAELPAFVNFPVLDLPAADTLPWGRRGFAASFEQARSLFNASMPKLREALEFYKLDGWVTDHVEVLFDVSKAYSCVSLLRCVVTFRCATHVYC